MEKQVITEEISLLERLLRDLHSHHGCAIDECSDPRCRQVRWGLSWLKSVVVEQAHHTRMACGY
jgi:hypothetical protein